MGAGIAAGHPLAAAAGRAVLDAGGNAADAAVAVAFLQGVIDPAKCGLGGWGTAVHRAADGTATAIDFPAVAGSLARPDQWADLVEAPAHHGYLPVLRGNVNDVGHAAIGVPSAVAGLAVLHERFGSGRLSWGRLLEPAIAAAREGMIVVDGVLGAGVPEWDWPGAVPLARRLAMTPAGARRYLPGGRLPRVGERIVQPELAATLELLARDGPESFRTGTLAERIAADLAAGGAHVTADDLAGATARVAPALRIEALGLVVEGTPPPESGISVAQVLVALADRVTGSPAADPDAAALVASTLGFAGAERVRELADPRAVPVDVDGMIERARRLGRTGPPPGPWRGGGWSASGGHTTSVVVLDATGGAVALNHSLAGAGGSGIVGESLGFLYNNTMAGFDARPGGRNAIAPGRARWSAACPTIAARPDGPVIALTGPGGSRAFAAVVEVLLALARGDEDPATAVDRPRYDVRGDVVDVEPDVPPAVRARLADDGWTVSDLPGRSVAAVYAVTRDAGSLVRAAADPRWPGSAQAR